MIHRALIAWIILLPFAAGANEQAQTVDRAVYHVAVSDRHHQNFALLNLENQLLDLQQRGRTATIKVILEDEGVSLLVMAASEQALLRRMERLSDQGVQFLVEAAEKSRLRSTLPVVGRVITDESWIDNAILTLVILERQGYAYIPYVTRH